MSAMSSGEERNVGERSVLCFAKLASNELFVRTLISRTNAYAGCGRPTLNFIERFVLAAKPLPQFVLKQSLILSSVFAVIIICCLGAMKIKDCRKTITLDLFQNYGVPEEESGTLDPEVDLNDDDGRSRYERFYYVRSPIMRQKI